MRKKSLSETQLKRLLRLYDEGVENTILQTRFGLRPVSLKRILEENGRQMRRKHWYSQTDRQTGARIIWQNWDD